MDIYIYIWQRLINVVAVNSMGTSAAPPWITQVDPSATQGRHKVYIGDSYQKACPSLFAPLLHACVHSHTVCYVLQQTCRLCHSADMSVVSHSRHVCCVAQPTFLLSHTRDMYAVSHSSLPCHTADMFVVSCGLLGSCGSPATGQLGGHLQLHGRPF